eukprot:2726777-Heterocapsa_arctica.AAC.1
MDGGDRRMVLAQPSVGAKVQPGEQKSAGESHPEASIEAGVSKDAVGKLRICFQHRMRSCLAVLQGGTALGFDGTQMSVGVDDAAGHGTIEVVEPR